MDHAAAATFERLSRTVGVLESTDSLPPADEFAGEGAEQHNEEVIVRQEWQANEHENAVDEAKEAAQVEEIFGADEGVSCALGRCGCSWKQTKNGEEWRRRTPPSPCAK